MNQIKLFLIICCLSFPIVSNHSDNSNSKIQQQLSQILSILNQQPREQHFHIGGATASAQGGESKSSTNPTLHASAQSSATSSAQVALEFWNIITEKTSDLLDTAKTNSQQTIISSYTNFKDFITHHKYSLAAAGITLGYACLWAKIMRAHLILYHPSSWSNWQEQLPLQTFLSLQQDVIEHKLLQEIQRRYINFDNPTDFISPILKFTTQLHQEIEAIETLKFYYKWINRLYAKRLFFITEKAIEEIEYKANRLYFIQHVFTTWSVNYNMHSTDPKNS